MSEVPRSSVSVTVHNAPVESILSITIPFQCAIRRSFAAMSAYPEYSLDVAIAEFFSQTSASREACDNKAKDLVGGKVVPVTVQGNCSYSVYAGPEFEFVVQFRLKSLMLKSEIVALAREIYGSLAPNASFHGQLGEDGKEPLFVYVMNRIQGISYLDFVLANGFPENSDENFNWRKTLMSDVAQYSLSFESHHKDASIFLKGQC